MSSRHVVAGLAALLLVPFGLSAGDATHHWTYKGSTGPTHWAALEPDFAACGSGHAQSPIDIRQDAVLKANLPVITVDRHGVNAFFVDRALFDSGFLDRLQGVAYAENIYQFNKFKVLNEAQFDHIKDLELVPLASNRVTT